MLKELQDACAPLLSALRQGILRKHKQMAVSLRSTLPCARFCRSLIEWHFLASGLPWRGLADAEMKGIVQLLKQRP